jgi:hypothetical protein
VIRDKKKLAELKVRRRRRIRSFYLNENSWVEFDKIARRLSEIEKREIGCSELLAIMIGAFRVE